jgi:hypothetical protein
MPSAGFLPLRITHSSLVWPVMQTYRPEVTERSAGTHKRTSREHQAAFGRLSDAILSGRNLSRFSVVCSSAAQI